MNDFFLPVRHLTRKKKIKPSTKISYLPKHSFTPCLLHPATNDLPSNPNSFLFCFFLLHLCLWGSSPARPSDPARSSKKHRFPTRDGQTIFQPAGQSPVIVRCAFLPITNLPISPLPSPFFFHILFSCGARSVISLIAQVGRKRTLGTLGKVNW